MPEPTADFKLAFEVLKAKQAYNTTLLNFYDGDQPQVYASERLQAAFKDKLARFSQNWCAVVADSELERINLNEFSIPTQTAAAGTLNDLFVDTELKLDASDVHTVALVCGESYVFVWKNEDSEIEAYYHDPRNCHVFYDPERPRRKRMAAKWWIDANEKRRINLYYPDHIEYSISTNKAENVYEASGFQEYEPDAANPYGLIPIFHFRRERRTIKSVLANVIEPQNAINKLTADMMVAAEFGAFAQRYAITDADISTLKNAPNEIWRIPAGDGDSQPTSVGQFPATELGNFLSAIDKLATNIAIITRTPKHYFFTQGGDPSGEALIAMEAPLNKKAQTTIDRFSPTWAEVGSFMLLLDGTTVAPRDITVQFDKPETVQPRTTAEIRQINKNAGLPLKTTLRNEGWTDAEIEQMEADADEEKQASQSSFAAALLEQQRQFGQAQSVPVSDNGNGNRQPEMSA